MENVLNVEKLESIKSLQSTISKSEKALAQMAQKGANTTLIEKRLKALYIGLAMLENVWNQKTIITPGRSWQKPAIFLLVYSRQLRTFMQSQRQAVLKEHFWKEELKHWK